MTAFCLCLKIPETKLKNNELIFLVEEISRQPNIGSVLWLLVVILMQVCRGKEQVEKSEIQNVQVKKKKSTREFKVGAKACTE